MNGYGPRSRRWLLGSEEARARNAGARPRTDADQAVVASRTEELSEKATCRRCKPRCDQRRASRPAPRVQPAVTHHLFLVCMRHAPVGRHKDGWALAKIRGCGSETSGPSRGVHLGPTGTRQVDAHCRVGPPAQLRPPAADAVAGTLARRTSALQPGRVFD